MSIGGQNSICIPETQTFLRWTARRRTVLWFGYVSLLTVTGQKKQIQEEFREKKGKVSEVDPNS